MAEILYAGLIGACSALLIAIIVGVPKLIVFLIKKIIKSTDKNAETKEETDSQKEQNEDS